MNKKTKIALLALCSIAPAICLVQAIVYAFAMGVLGLDVNLLGITADNEARLVSLGILIMLSLAGMAAVGPFEVRK